MSQFECRVEPTDQRLRVSLAGEFDLVGRWDFALAVATVLAQAPAEVVLDLSGLRFIDSTGRGAILHFVRELGPGRVRIIPGAEAVQRVFELTGLTSLLPFVTGDQSL